MLYASIRGGAPERLCVAIHMIGGVIGAVIVSMPQTFSSLEKALFGVDILVFLAFVMLAIRANRFWPIWATALMGLGLACHLALMLNSDVGPWAYAVVVSFFGYPLIPLIIGGTFAHRLRLARDGIDPDWMPSPRSFGWTPRQGSVAQEGAVLRNDR
jgi:hypothetical protein